MIDTTGYRSKEQVLCDLSKNFPFSPEALEANRQGRLGGDQFKRYISKCSRPAIMATVCFFGPILFWTAMTASRQHVSALDALPIFLNSLIHLSQTMEDQGKIGTIAMLGSTVAFIGLGFFLASKISTALYFDLMERRVDVKEGRVTGREEQIMRENGRDPVERYFFSVKTKEYEVSLGAFRALESGSVYLLYTLPRSEILVALEPKVTGK
jgi:hypothetical protein